MHLLFIWIPGHSKLKQGIVILGFGIPPFICWFVGQVQYHWVILLIPETNTRILHGSTLCWTLLVAQASTREHPLLTCDSRSLSKNVPWEMFGLQRRFFKMLAWGLKAFRALRLLFSRPPKMQGWSPTDRVVDAPVYQDIPTWKRGPDCWCPL